VEIDVALGMWAESNDKLSKSTRSIEKMLRLKPVHKPVGGSAIGTGATPLVIPLELVPPAGRIWNILRLGIFGSDAHSPLAFPDAVRSTAAGGAGNSQALPTGQSLAGFTVSLAAPGTASSTVTVTNTVTPAGLSGTLTYELPVGTTVVAQNFNPPLTNIPGGPGITVTLAATTGAGQSAIDLYGTVDMLADFYVTSALESAQPPLPDCVESSLAIPTIVRYSRGVEWCRYGEQIVAYVYNIPLGQQVVAIARVAEYPLEAVETLVI
jgi:hypothetical protein